MALSALETCMEAAASGSAEAASRFFRLFLDSELFVPERFQPTAIHNQAEYPNLVINLLALKSKDHPLVPVFSEPAYAEEWAGKRLNLRKITGASLRDLIPAGWWLCLNPGQELEKEISAWELEQLKDVRCGIPAIVAELFSETAVLPLSVRELAGSEYQGLQTSLKSLCAAQPEIKRLWLGMEERTGQDGKGEAQTLIAGLLLKIPGDAAVELIRAEIGKQLIGGIPFRVFHESDERSLRLSVFMKLAPLFEREAEVKKPWWAVLAAKFRG